MAVPNKPVNPYERQRGLASEDTSIDNAVTPAADAAKPGGIEIDTDKVLRTDDIEYEKFMRDELEVFFNEPGNEHEPAFVEVNVNGDYRIAIRGDTTKLRRYHVAVIANAKQSRVRQKKIVNQDGSMGFQEENVLSLSYPFQIMHDPNPKQGGPWLRQLLKNPG
jgi:hypothetical protein